MEDLDPEDRARELVETDRELLEEARRELGEGNVEQAAGKVWGHSLSREGLHCLERGP